MVGKRLRKRKNRATADNTASHTHAPQPQHTYIERSDNIEQRGTFEGQETDDNTTGHIEKPQSDTTKNPRQPVEDNDTQKEHEKATDDTAKAREQMTKTDQTGKKGTRNEMPKHYPL